MSSTGSGGQVLANGSIGYSSDYAIFTKPISNVGTADVKYIKYRPVNDFTNGEAPIEFRIPSSGNLYSDFKRSKLYVRGRIVKGNGDPLPAWGKKKKKKEDGTETTEMDVPAEAMVGPANLFMHSLFQQVDVLMNGKLVSNANPAYPYMAYLKTLTEYSSEAKNTQLRSQLWAKDTCESIDDITYPLGENEGLKQRADLFRESREVDMVGPLHSPVLNLDRFVLNGVETRIVLHQTGSPFRFISANTQPSYKFEIKDIYYMVCHVVPSPPVLVAHQESLKVPGALAHFSYMNREMRQFTIAQGSYVMEVDDAFLGMVPSNMIMALVESEAYNGSFRTNPYNLKHKNLNYLQVTVNGQEVPAGTYTPSFENGHYIQEYMSLFKTLHMEDEDRGCDITPKDYGNGYTMYAIDLQPQTAEAQEGFWPLRQKGNVRIHMRFARALDKACSLIVQASYPSFFSLDHSRNVIRPNP